MPMGRKQKETVELRFYEIPQGEPVLALLGEEWNRVYETGYTDMTIFICISITLWRLEFAEKAKGSLL